MAPPRYVAVCGASEPTPVQVELAREVGRRLGEAGAVVLCGGRGGVMEAASQGAAESGATVVGILPGSERSTGNPYLTLALATGLGHARNSVLVCSADAVVAIGRGWGTLSEIGLARSHGRSVVALDSWPVEGLTVAASAEEAVKLALG
ncbi:MAG: TIGR00725 family protein [Candidatus Dormibacteraeota bacterium]|nr:TIGR00725 family protein [Candidatus Dormibacteraeota bacterium]